MKKNPLSKWLVVLFMLAAAARAGWVMGRFAGGERWKILTYPDEQAYSQVADALAHGRGLVDEFGFRATYMPAYPAFLAVFSHLPRSLLWARLAQALLGALAAPAAYLLAWQWVRLIGYEPRGLPKDWIAVLAGLGVCFDPFGVFFSGLLLTETLFTTALVLAWLFILPMSKPSIKPRVGQAVAAGFMLWICILLRPSAAILVLLTPAAVLICRRGHAGGLTAGILMIMTVLIGLLPWAYRNYVTIGQWRWLTTRGGISLYDGLHGGATGVSDLAHTKSIPELRGLNELQWDAYFHQRACSAVRENPWRVLRLGGVKFLRTWSLRPNVETYRQGPAAVLSVIWMTAVLAAAAAGWWIHRRAVRAWSMLLLPVAGFTLLHTIFVGSVRYRVPLMPMVMVLAAAGVVGLSKGGKSAAAKPTGP